MEHIIIVLLAILCTMGISWMFTSTNNFTILWILNLYDLMAKLLKENQFCQAILFSSISAYILYILRAIYRSYILPFIAGMSSSITIHNTDQNFNAVIDYLSDKMLSDVRAAKSSMQASTKTKKWTRKQWIQEYLGTNTRDVQNFEYRPDNDQVIHSFLYHNKTIYLTRSKSSNPLMGSDSTKPFTPESLTLTVWGSNNKLLKDLLLEALKASMDALTEDSLNIYTQSSSPWLTGWELAMTKKARPKDSVILDVDDMDFLLDDAKNFLNNAKWYYDRGIPYRRGYLLYGPPGCGKTSFAQVLAGELKLDICMLNLTHKGLNDNSLCEYLRDAPRNSLIVLEDIDAIFVERSAATNKKNDSSDVTVSFSGLLNAIDGVASQEGKIFFMTTNHIEKLDPALIRPGRCDVKLEVKLASKQQIERMFLRFYPNEYELAKKFVSRLPANELSMASLQGHFLNSKQTAQECVERTTDLLQSVKLQFKSNIKTIYEHLHRIGLERYCHVFEFGGYSTSEDLVDVTLADILPFSIELQYDSNAQKLIKQLLSSDSNFIINSYAMATISEIRSAFLAAYPTSYEKKTGEIAPLFRRQSSLTTSSKLHDEIEKIQSINELDDDDNIAPPMMLSLRNNSSDSKSSSISSSTQIKDISPEQLNNLSRIFCEKLSRNGKGVISLYNLKKLLESHPNRPYCAVNAISNYIQKEEYNINNKIILKSLSLYDFLKRAGASSSIHYFERGGVTSVEKLINLKSDKKELQEILSNKYKLSDIEASNLSEILTKSTTESGTLINFSLHYRSRIMHMFTSFYGNNPSDRINIDDSKEDSDSNSNNEVKINWNEKSIEQFAYEYGIATTDSKGFALVSLIEISNHLKKHPYNPNKAIETVKNELLNPPKPSPPPPKPAPVEPTEWVYTWLKGNNEELAQYANKFIDECLTTKEDLIIGGKILDDALLKDVLGVSKLGHRRKILFMHEQLLANASN